MSRADGKRTPRFALRPLHQLLALRGGQERQQLVDDAAAEGVADDAVDVELVFFAPSGLGWVGEAPVEAARGAGEDGAGLVGAVADSDYGVEGLREVTIERLALVRRDV